ncbi:hypothetical protein BRD20_06960 [Halobacteriales archaeon SW_8_65_20]|nr:MAG: hypothetical protein BRD20_06960 [Halobacteriales archaeon SW_8_65_20]
MTSNTLAETAVDRFQDRIPASLYEVAWQYSLYDWYNAATSADLDWDLAPEHLAYLTPRAKSGLFGEPDSLITVYADLSDPQNPQLGTAETTDEPVEITTLTEAGRYQVGHSYPEGKTSSMTDYSITTHKGADAHHIAGLRDDAWGTNNIQDRFTDWAQSEYAEEVRKSAEPDEAAILEGLATLGDDDTAMDELADSFLRLVDSEDDEIEALITVRVKPPGATEYKYPGEVPVLNDVMRAKKADRLTSISVENAEGEATGYVSDTVEAVTGGSPGLFGMFGKKQREHFADLDTEGQSAWRNRPLSFDVAAAVAVAGSVFDDFYQPLGSSRRLYVLPYLATRGSETDPETFERFYREVFTELQSADTGEDGTLDETVTELFDSVRSAYSTDSDSSSELSLGTSSSLNYSTVRIAVVYQVTGNPDRVFFDTLDGVFRPLELEDAHNTVLCGMPFDSNGIFEGNPSPESSWLLGKPSNLTRLILYGVYFRRTTEPTRSSRQANETPGAGAADDSRFSPVKTLLTDGKLSAATLLENYLHQLVQDQREQFDDDGEYIAFPKRSVVEQYIQLRALTDAGFLDSSQTLSFETTPMIDEYDSRDDRLAQFLESHAALDGDPQRAVFILGGLVGRITAYQDYEDISSTLVRRYPVDYLTKQTVQEVTKEVLQMNNSYAEAEDSRSYQTLNRYTDRLPDLMLSATLNDWSLTEAELQWLYSLGIAYGLSDTSLDTDDEQSSEQPLAADDN